MTIYRHGIKLTEKGNGIAVLWPSGEKRFVINAKMPDEKDYRKQDIIIYEAGKPREDK